VVTFAVEAVITNPDQPIAAPYGQYHNPLGIYWCSILETIYVIHALLVFFCYLLQVHKYIIYL